MLAGFRLTLVEQLDDVVAVDLTPLDQDVGDLLDRALFWHIVLYAT